MAPSPQASEASRADPGLRGPQQRLALRAGDQERMRRFGRQRVTQERVDGDAAAARHRAALRGDDDDGVERSLPALREHVIGAVEDRSRPRHVEQLEPRINDEGNAVHWRKIPRLWHLRQAAAR